MTDQPATNTVAVALNRPLPEPYHYLVPADLMGRLLPGMLVEVPLQSRREIGVVVACDPPAPAARARAFRLKEVLRRVAPDYQLSPEIMDLAAWVADYYFCTLGEVLATTSMIGFSDERLRERTMYSLDPLWRREGLTARQIAAAEAIARADPGSVESIAEMTRAAGATSAVVKKLVEAGVVLCRSQLFAEPPPPPAPDVPPPLLLQQAEALDRIDATRRAGEFGVFLLHGVTGSGKTEVYLRLIERVLAEGKSALCLVPEIALTPQTVDRFARRFQTEVGVFHSQMNRTEKLLLAEKIRRGMVRLVIGARSATFAPFPNLGIIIIDEEHEGSYKQSESPRYHARDVAIVRASRLRIPVVLGSATPSLESYENARRGKYTLLLLSQRPADLQMPAVSIVPMGQAAVVDPGAVTMISAALEAGIRQRLAAGEQTVLFLNRRGFSNFLMCPHCRWVARCEDDDIVMTIHRKGGRAQRVTPGAPEEDEQELELELFPRPLAPEQAYLKCHFCGKTGTYPKVCPTCGEGEVMAVGSGTQRLEEALRRLFPDTFILRLDQDAVGGRRAFLQAWHQMVSGEAQIILGTQMIAKGLHLERVTLVGVILADVGLFLPDFRAEERTFSLLTQVAGRAGRVNMGEVILQTYLPHHAAIQLAARHDYVGFFEREIERRQKMRFPPVEKLIALTLSDKETERASHWARVLGSAARRATHIHGRGTVILGPRPAPIERLAGRHRQRILLRGENWRTNAAVLRAALADREWAPPDTLRLSIDVDPMDML